MSFIHTLKSLFVSDYELKKEVTNIVAVSIFMDSIIRPSEVRKGYEIIEKLFEGEDYEFLIDEIDIELELFQKNASIYLESKKKAMNFIRDNKNLRKELIGIVRLIFRSDHEMHSKEEEMISILERELKKGEEDEKNI